MSTPGAQEGGIGLPVPETLGRRRRLWMLSGFLVVLMIAFVRPLAALAYYAAGSDLHSHILLVPVVSAYLLRLRWSSLPRDYESSPAYAVAVGLLGAVALVIASNLGAPKSWIAPGGVTALTMVSFVCFVAAGGFFLLGREWMGAAGFPIGFLLFLAPLPDGWVNWLETMLKYASADVSALLFGMTGTPIMRDGLLMYLPGITLEVAQECSGIRSSWVLFITSLLVSYLFLHSPWRRAVLVGFVLPLAILRNGFRILTIGLLCVHVGPEMISSVVHNRGGPLFFVLSLVPLFALLWWLRRGERVQVQGLQGPLQR